jgi:predicted ATP-dependent endonuclease of OLD family
MSSDYATNDFIRRMYGQYTEDDIKERAVHKGKYRQLKTRFRTESLESLNRRIPADKNYAFGLKPSSVYGLESDLMIFEDNISIDSKGTGKQVFIKTDFALERSGANVDVVLIEEPENHLSHVNLRRLIQRVSETQSGQLFVATHSSMISTRLELQNVFIMHVENAGRPVPLSGLSADTAKYFMKAPVAGILEFVISSKTILVEGPSEYMLFEKFYESLAGHKPEADGVHIIDVHGLSFKRYLEIAKLLGNKVAVITDNDKNPQKNCIDKYSEFDGANIEVFYETDEKKYTFEVVLYGDNGTLCDTLFGGEALVHMLNNKTESAYTLLEQHEAITVPDYIRRAIEWIKN